jgi:hypothetical protein
VQQRYYSSNYDSELLVIGLILARMGNHVSYILKRNEEEFPEDSMDAARNLWQKNTDNKMVDKILQEGLSVGRFYYGYPCYDYAQVVTDKENYMASIVSKYKDEEAIVLGRDPEFISEDIELRKVFVDFSSPFDETYLKEEVGEEKINRMYKCADVVVTADKNYSSKNQQVIQIDEDTLESTQLYVEKEIPYYDPTIYTEDYLDIALKIAEVVERE